MGYINLGNIENIKSLLDEVLEENEWAYYTQKEKLNFGLDENNAAFSRNNRSQGVH